MSARALLACFAAGVTAVPLSKRYGELHCKKILDKIRPDAVITDRDGKLSVKRLENPRYQASAVHPALIMCTSGTTGSPKGAMLTEENILTNVSDIAEYSHCKTALSLCGADRRISDSSYEGSEDSVLFGSIQSA